MHCIKCDAVFYKTIARLAADELCDKCFRSMPLTLTRAFIGESPENHFHRVTLHNGRTFNFREIESFSNDFFCFFMLDEKGEYPDSALLELIEIRIAEVSSIAVVPNDDMRDVFGTHQSEPKMIQAQQQPMIKDGIHKR